ncbi:MAG TPA: 16S rRNA (cytidine(1402)-2'-O)-methyltransferase [Pyrinomonadaceae bacterium]|nr:16S rRNA (cytidine(1402)-2'-O)-methyltransferase [Pyrinomonadaceae bacterium]
MTGTVYLVATPIGNLQDMTFRAVETLRSVGVIACEDTRHTKKLLNHFGISNKLVSYHEHNESERAEELIDVLNSGVSIAVVSDAGTPGICDPSFRLVGRAIEIGAAVIPVPGAVAFVNAVAASGLPTDAIFFGGFLPSKKGDRRRRLQELAAIPGTLSFYESPRRIAAAIMDAFEILGDRRAVVAREITKMHEEFSRGKLSELHTKFSSATVKGEIVLLIDRFQNAAAHVPKTSSLKQRLEEIEAEGMERKAALKKVAREFGISKSEAYRIVQTDKK